MSTHPNSKKVTIYRLQPFNHQAQKGLDEWFANANTSIGSYFKKGGSKRVETGLEDWEAKRLLTMMVNAEAGDKDFKEKVEKYFIDINTKVGSDGLELEIGLEENNSKGIFFKKNADDEEGVENYPISLEDYITYRHALLHPFVAIGKEEGESNPLAKFYIEDKNKEASHLIKSETIKDEALALYLEMSKDNAKVSMFLALLGTNYKNINKEERPLALKNLAIKNAQLFIDTVNDKDAATKFFIKRLVSADIILKEGNRYLYEGEQLGITLTDFVLYVQDKANSETVGIMKAKLAEFGK
jgi:hypothetical protein